MPNNNTITVGSALIRLLEQANVDTIFGIPGVHTIELYRGLAPSHIQHITPRHEQAAAFMADGYARITGKPGVCILITGPGLTNAITAMAQARAESVPMLVISSVNSSQSLGKGRGHLHELPDQAGLSATIALWTHTLLEAQQLPSVFEKAYRKMSGSRPGPVHIEIPLDIMSQSIELSNIPKLNIAPKPQISKQQLHTLIELCMRAKKPLILCGGGAINATTEVRTLASQLNAPTVSTVNARGLMSNHHLDVPASPSLRSIRDLIQQADLILAIGTEIGPTDYDMYETGELLDHPNLVRVDIDQDQLTRGPSLSLSIQADAKACLEQLCHALSDNAPLFEDSSDWGDRCATQAREDAQRELSDHYLDHVKMLQDLWATIPNAIIVGDSTQVVYAGNLYLQVPFVGAWFNSATGFGTLGYAAPAAIGAALGRPDHTTICLIGDGGLQFTLAELGSAHDTQANVVFIVWNNHGYQEIENAMLDADINPIGVTPSAPDFTKIAQAYGLPARRVTSSNHLFQALRELSRPCLIEFDDQAKTNNRVQIESNSINHITKHNNKAL